MANNYIPRCKLCKGTGAIKDKTCRSCEGTGVRLQNEIDEEINDYLEATDEKIFPDQAGFIDIEEEDYEI